VTADPYRIPFGPITIQHIQYQNLIKEKLQLKMIKDQNLIAQEQGEIYKPKMLVDLLFLLNGDFPMKSIHR